MDKSSTSTGIDRARPASQSAAHDLPATPLASVDWYALRRNRQIGMTATDRAEYARWARRVGLIYVGTAVLTLAIVLTLAHDVLSQDQIASRLRASPIGSAAARIP